MTYATKTQLDAETLARKNADAALDARLKKLEAPAPLPAPPPATTLQSQIDATPTGGTLTLVAATYHEAVTVNRAMTITGPAIIDGDGVRPTWMTVRASDVTVDGLTMRNAAAGSAQSGSLDVAGSRFTLRNANLSGGSYANLRLWDGGGHVIDKNVIAAGRAIGILGWNVTDATFSANRLTGNNTTNADPGNEAGGMKLGQSARITVTGNEVDHNVGPGIWFDVYCTTATITANKVHHNSHQGIFWEISTGADISGNAVWENGYAFPAWGWGGGILVSSSAGADVHDNTVAWNADGIIVISQSRAGSPSAVNNHVRNNVVAMAAKAGDTSDKMAVAWLQDWAGVLFSAGTNTGSGNKYYVTTPEPQWARFGWNGPLDTLAKFNATPGEEGGTYLTAVALAPLLAAAGVPGAQE